MRKRSTGLLPFSAESEGERVICPDRAGSEGIEIDAPKGGKNGWIRCTARGMLVAGTFQGTSQIGETQAAQGVRALLKEVPLSPPAVSKSPWKQGLFCFYGPGCHSSTHPPTRASERTNGCLPLIGTPIGQRKIKNRKRF